MCKKSPKHLKIDGPSWSRSYGSWIYNYQYMAMLSVTITINAQARCTQYNIM